MRGLGERFRRTLRFGDNAGRIGGDEFAMILPNTEPDLVPALLDRVRRADGVDSACPAFSYGVAQCPQEATSFDAARGARRRAALRGQAGEAMTPARPNDIWSIDDLELELRQLPGVRSAGFDDSDDVLLVQLHVSDPANRADAPDQAVPVSASRIAARHSDRPVAVEIVRWRNAPGLARRSSQPRARRVPQPNRPRNRRRCAATRCRLLAVLSFPETDELEVHLVFDGRRTIGRAPASRGAEGSVVATLDAVRDLGTGLNARMKWARALDATIGDDSRQTVAVALEGVDARSPVNYGLSAGISLIDAASRATLDALNRHLGRAR